MPTSALGVWLKGLRDERGLSLRELAQRSEVDHAYIHRLETGAKEAPSGDVISKLIPALDASPRDAEILKLLANQQNIDPDLVEFVRADAGINFDEFRMLTTMVNRGARPDFATSLARIRRILSEDEDG
jgi:transcriptional regulator with XRE-family HTH domain